MSTGLAVHGAFSLKAFNTFGLECTAERFVEAFSVEDVQTFVRDPFLNSSLSLLLGGGSNVLLTATHLPGTVLHVAIKHREVLQETLDYVDVRIGAGEPWHDFVLWTLENGWGGAENLSLIPGQVGTAPVQNIGAYGVELNDICTGVHFVERESGTVGYYTREQCAFGYRDSVFKKELKDKCVLVSVDFRFTKRNHLLKTHYGTVEDQLTAAGQLPSPKTISDAVIAIRQSKLPDPAKLGNSGSFFKNPYISKEQFSFLQSIDANAPGYLQPDGEIKAAAGWLIEKAGWKGFRRGDAGVHALQALVLVNYGQATGPEIWELAQDIIADVQEKFKIGLEPEVNLVG